MSTSKSAILLIHCKDQSGIVNAVTDFIYTNGGNILHLAQHVDAEPSRFFMRIEWDLGGFKLESGMIGSVFDEQVGVKFKMQRQLSFSDEVPRMALFVSKLPHCFYDILARLESGEWNIEIPLIISNHENMRPAAERLGIEYHCVPITPDNKQEQESKQLALMEEHKIDFIVLARYMQILSKTFIERFPQRIINIHHSFLPAFPGSKPYHSAHERGVKIIGATSHYVTAELDAGPIIEQDVVHVSHEDSVQDMVRKGRDLEKIVLSRAIWNQCRQNILVCGNKTVVF
jgi:formyltetrahydrofolate deformylase